MKKILSFMFIFSLVTGNLQGASYPTYGSGLGRGLPDSIMNAIRNDDSKSLHEALMASNRSVDSRDNSGKTLSMIAIESGKASVFKYLMENGASIDAQDFNKNGLLHYASDPKTANESMVKMLIEKKLDVNAKNKEGRTPLMIAAEDIGWDPSVCDSVNPGVIQLLLNAGADPILTSNNGDSAYAAIISSKCLKTKNRLEILKLFLDAGVSVSQRTERNKTVFDYAKELGYMNELIELLHVMGLQRKDEIKAFKEENKVPGDIAGIVAEYLYFPDELKDAIEWSANDSSALDTIEKLIVEKPSRISAVNELGYTPFLWAVYMGNLAAVKRIIDVCKVKKIIPISQLLDQRFMGYKKAQEIAEEGMNTATTYQARQKYSDLLNFLFQQIDEAAKGSTSTSTSSSSVTQ